MKNKNYSIIIIILLLVVILLLVGYICCNKSINSKNPEKETNEVNKVENNLEDNALNYESSGECPFTKLDLSYVLTDKDKNEIIESLDNLNAGFNKEDIVKDSIKITGVSDNKYFLYLKGELDKTKYPNYEFGTLAIKVNNKFKVLTAGSGYDGEFLNRFNKYLDRICS